MEDQKKYKSMRNIIEQAIRRYEDTLSCLVRLEEYDTNLFIHSLNTAYLSLLLGKELDMPEKELDELYIAGLMHDFGKLHIPRRILNKKGPLTGLERGIIELHPVAGFVSLIRNTVLPDTIINAVLDHHENADGSGYGSHKDSNTISEYAKIIAIADRYDAMVSERVYRKAISRTEVRRYLIQNAGKCLDLELVNKFLEIEENIDVARLEKEHTNRIRNILISYKSDYHRFDISKHSGLVNEG